MSTYLMHHGIRGQKWGVRRYENPDGTLTEAGKRRYAENYDSKQRRRDLAVYGCRGVKRINKRMLEGESISGARSYEASRIASARRSARTAGQIGATAGSIGGAIGGYFASKYLKTKIPALNEAMRDPTVNMAVSAAVSAGAASVGTSIGRYGGQSIAMIAGGYSPDKYR